MNEDEFISPHEYESRLSTLLEDARFSFLKHLEKNPDSGNQYLNYLQDVLFLNSSEHKAPLVSYSSKLKKRI